MDPIEIALLAIDADDRGDSAAARRHVSRAKDDARSRARRDRQLVEIAALVVGGHRERAAGLALEHASAFPEDGEVLRRITERSETPQG